MTQPGDGAQSGIDPSAQGGVNGNAGDGVNDGGAGAQGGTGGDGSAAAPTGRVYSEAEYAAIQNRMRAADQRAATLEAERNQLRDKDLPALEKAQRDLAEAQQAREKAETELKNSRLHNAFLRDNTYDWHDPDTTLSMLDMDKVDIDAEGNVSGLKLAIEALAKAKPYLIKPAPDGDGGDGKPNGPQGTVPANNGGAGGGKPDAKQLGGRFSALRNR